MASRGIGDRGLVEPTVDARALYRSSDPSTEERLVLDLATAIHESRGGGVAVSWEAQGEAAAYLNEHGMCATIGRLRELQASLGQIPRGSGYFDPE
jgi:hypothetical protein